MATGDAKSSVRFLGTGTAFHEDGRGSQALYVEPAGERPMLVDVGPTAISRLERAGLHYAELERLLITHLHGDHMAGWPFLLLNLQLRAHRRAPLEVVGPEGTRRCLEGLAVLCYGDLLIPERLGFEVRYRELEVAEARGLTLGAGSLDVLPMEHHESSLGFRVRLADGGVLGVTGDTRWCERVERLAEGCDLFVIECSTVEPQPYAHVSLEELRERSGRLAARSVVLTHLTDAVAAALATDPIERVVAAYDGMIVELR